MTLSLDRLNKARAAGYQDEDIVNSIARNDSKLGERISKARESGYDNATILSSIERNLNKQSKPALQTSKASYADYFKQGLQQSASGELVNIGKTPEQIKEDPNFWEALVQESGSMAGDAPFMLAGSMLGSATGASIGSYVGPYGTVAGGVLGGGFGALAVPEFLKSALSEYRDYVAQGNDLTFGEFLDRADKVASHTLNSGLMGSILGMVNKAAPLLKNLPGIGKLFSSKLSQKAANVGLETATLASVPAISEGRLPEGKDFAHAAAIVAGFNLVGLPKEIRNKLEERGKASGLSPEEFAKSAEAKEILDTAEKVEGQKEKAKPEKARQDIETREPANALKSEKDVKATNKAIDSLPQGNQKNLAKEAVRRGYVRNPEQLNLFLDEYDAIYDGLPGKEGRKKNQEFMKEYASKNVQKREIKPLEGKPVVDVKPTPERQLEIGRQQVREAKYEGDKAKQKEAQKRIDLSKRKLTSKANKKAETPKEDVKRLDNEAVKPEVGQEVEYISGVSKGKKGIITKYDGKTMEVRTDNSLQSGPVSSLLQELKAINPSSSVKVKPHEKSVSVPKKEKVPEPIIETTGEGAEERLEEPPSKARKLKEKTSSVIIAAKNPQEVFDQVYTKAFDALDPISRLEKDIPVEERVTTKIKQAQSAASEINNLLTQGIFDNVSNTFQSGSLQDAYMEGGELWSKLTKGLKPGEYSVKEMDVYRVSKESLKRQQRGLKSGVDTKKATDDVARLKQKYGPIDQRLHKFQTETVNHYGEHMLGPERIEQWTQDSHASLYRTMDYGSDSVVKEGSLEPKKWWHRAKGSLRKILPPSETDILNLSMLVSQAKKNDSVLQYKKLVEQGKLPGKIVQSKNRAVPEKMMEDLQISPENKALAENLYNQSRKDAFTPEVGRIRGWEKGKAFEIEVPRDVYETFASLAPTDTGMFTQAFKTTNQIMSKGIVLEPFKALTIFGRDAWSSLIYSKTGWNPLSIGKAISHIIKNSHDWNQFKSLGGEQYASRLLYRTERIEKITELLKAEHPNAIEVPYHQLSKFLSKVSKNLAAAVPFAEYQRAVKKFGDTPSGRLQALIESKSVSYDPTKRGSHKLVKDAANFFPFFNVMLQEPVMIASHMKRPQFWAKGIVGMTLPTLLLHMYNDGNPDYDDMNILFKMSHMHFYTKDSHYFCPVPWLLGALFKGVPQLFYDMLKGKGGDAWKGLYSYVASQLSGSFPPIAQAIVEQSTGESLPSPAGLALMPFADVEKRVPPVVPKRLQNLPPEKQYTSKTSQAARWFGDLWKVSPVKVERLVNTFLGGLGADGLALIDEMAYASGMVEDLRPEQGWKNYLLLGKFIRDSTPSSTKYTSEFYSKLEEAKMNKQRGKPNDVEILNRYNTRISKKFHEYRDIEDKKMDPKRKRDLLLQKQKEINDLYKEAVKKVK